MDVLAHEVYLYFLFVVLKRAQDITEERKNEHKRWRAAIDGYAQYSEWICKVNEKVEDMPDLDSAGSVVTTEATDDPEAEYFIAVDSMRDVIDQVGRNFVINFIQSVLYKNFRDNLYKTEWLID